MNNITKTNIILLALLPVIFGQVASADTNLPGEKPGVQSAPVIQLEPEFAANVAVVKVDSAPLLRAGTIHVAKNYKWQGLTFTAEPRAGDGSIPFKWKVAGLGLDGTGTFKNPKPAVMQWDWHLTNDKEWVADGTDVGNNPYGAIVFFLDLTSDARRGCTAKPVLKEDKTGFTWEMLPGKTVTVDFGAPLVKLYFETNKPSEIRCVMYMAPLEQGKFDRSMTITLPEGSSVVPTKAERYHADTKDWFVDALDPHASFIDLSDLNEKPAGKHGFVKTKGERLCFSDDTPVHFWGAAVAAYTLYVHNKDGTPDKELIDKHAKRLAALGFNLVRLTHVDSSWVGTNLIAKGTTTDKLDDAALDTLFYWVKALKEQGIYVWIDMATYRPFVVGDNIPGFDDLVAAYNLQKPLAEGFSYLNPRVEELWQTTSQEFLTRVNPYTKLALKDDPALAGVMIWNENSIMGVNVFRITAKTPWHQARYFEAIKAFAEKNGLPEATLKAPWTAQAKLVQNDIEYQWNQRAADFLRKIGVKVPITADQIWGPMSSSSLPALTAGDVTDSHAYSRAEFINANPHYVGTPFQAFAWSRLADRPKIITEYNVSGVGEAAEVGCDAFTIMPYIAAMGGFQGWEASMLYAYSQSGLGGNNTCSPWDSYNVAPLIGMAPAAALIYREGHVRPAEKTVYFPLSEEQSIYQATDQTTSRAARTVEERHKLLVGLDTIKELGWLKPTPAPKDVEVVTDLQRDFIPEGNEVVSDTGELKRNWVNGTYVIDTPKTQLAMGRLKGETIRTANVVFTIQSPEAAVALSSLDSKPLKESKRILLTTAARMEYKDKHFRTEPVQGLVELESSLAGIQLIPLKGDGTKMTPIPLQQKAGLYNIPIPETLGTHWFLIEGK